jgi:asparagine synthase (glutamine-hydrolysing)
MCGIFGIIQTASTQPIDKSKVKEAAALMKHRGPDAYGQWGISDKVELAHLRLAIIDLSPDSNQPFFSSCGNYVIVFNGEIFNYIEIREELKIKGYSFRTSSDTEVLLNSFIEWGAYCVNRFNGDWAFAIYDIKKNSLFCSRDRFGVKPFNYALHNGQFIFSSEIKSIISYSPALKNPNYNVIANYCRNSLGGQIEQTWFEGVKRLLPAHNLFWENGKLKIEKYWHYPTETIKNHSLKEAAVTYKNIFVNAVKLRMRSDVPIGTTLSSGIDSSSIVSVLRKFYGEDHKTFTAVFNQDEFQKLEKQPYKNDIKVNEAILVKQLASQLHLEAHFIDIQNKNFLRDLSNVLWHLESGHSSPATIPLSNILNYASNHVTVVMEGQGADELLGGYIVNIFIPLLTELFKKGQMKELLNEYKVFAKTYSLSYSFKIFIRLMNNSLIEYIYHANSGTNKAFGPKLKTFKRIKDYPLAPPAFSEHFNEVLFKSHTGGLVNLLHYGDAISMSHSLESRLPFMDVNLVEYAFKLPFQYKMHNGLGKYIHRKSMRGIVPDFILDNPLKFGFNTPLAKHFNSMQAEANKILLSEKCLERGIFERKGLQNLIYDQINEIRDNSTVLFRFLSVELWFRTFIDQEVSKKKADKLDSLNHIDI